MALESASYLNQLNSANPASSDSLKEADDHIRLIKSVLQNTFPNITGVVTANQASLNSPFPVGGIIMWSGSIASIPTGWTLCNGVAVSRSDGSGTITPPNLLNRFIIGAGDGANTGDNPSKYAVAATGGAETVTLTTAQIPAHTHTITASGTASSAGAHTHGVSDPGHSHSVVVPASDRTGAGGGAILGPQVTSISPGTTASGTGISIQSGGAHTHSLSLSVSAANTGGGEAHDNIPPYYALAYIMKI